MISGGRDNKVIGGGVADGSVGQTISMPAIQRSYSSNCVVCVMLEWSAGFAIVVLGMPCLLWASH